MRYRRQIRSVAGMAPQPYHQQQFLLAMLQSQLPVQTQLEWVFRCDDFEVLNPAIMVTIQLPLTALAPHVVRALETTANDEQKFYWTWRLGALEHEAIDRYLIAILQSNADVKLRNAAAVALHRGYRPHTAEPLLTLGCDLAQPTELRWYAFRAFIKQGRSLLPRMVPLLQHKDVIVRWGALMMMDHDGDPSFASSVEPLTHDLTIVPHGEVQIKDLAQAILLRWTNETEKADE